MIFKGKWVLVSILTIASTLTLSGLCLATVYGIKYAKKNPDKNKKRDKDQVLWDQKINKSNYVYNNLFFPVSSWVNSSKQVDELASKYVFFDNKHFEKVANKQNLLKDPKELTPLKTFIIKFSDFQDETKNPQKLSFLNFLAKQLNEENLVLNNYAKAKPSKKLGIDFGKDLIKRELYIRVWDLNQNNVSQEDHDLIQKFKQELQQEKKRTINKEDFLHFFRAENLFSRNYIQFLQDVNHEQMVEQKDGTERAMNENNDPAYLKNVVEENVSLEQISPQNKDQLTLKTLVDKEKLVNKNILVKNLHLFTQMLLEHKIAITTKSYINANGNVSFILFFEKLSSDFHSQLFAPSSVNEICTKNPKYIETYKFNVTQKVEEATSVKTHDNVLDLEKFLIPANKQDVPAWKQFLNDPLVSIGLEMSGNFLPSLDPYLCYIRKLFSKLSFLSENQINKLLESSNIQEEISNEIRNNPLINTNDFSYFLSHFQDDLKPFWLNLNALSTLHWRASKSSVQKEQVADSYRLFQTVMGLKIVGDHLLPLIQKQYPDIYNNYGSFGDAFRSFFNILKQNKIIEQKVEFLNLLSYFKDHYQDILKNILLYGDKLAIPKDITENIWSFFPLLGITIPDALNQDNKKEVISHLLENYLNKPGSLKMILVHFLGGYENARQNETKNRIKNIFEGYVLKNVINSLLDNTNIDPALLDVITNVIYELNLNKIVPSKYQNYISIISSYLSVDLNTKKGIKTGLEKIVKDESLKKIIRNWIKTK